MMQGLNNVLLALGTLALVVSGISRAAAADITVFAAASLNESITEAAKSYETETGLKVKFNFGASGTLARQIIEGAPAALFISAAEKWNTDLKAKELLTKDGLLLRNELVLVSGKDAPDFKIDFKPEYAFASAFKGKLSLGEPESVPAGKYAQDALKKLGWWDGVKDRLILSKDVREAMRVVEMGGADLAVVYKTDALVSKEVKIIGTFPAFTHAPITYTIGVVKGAGDDAVKFYNFLLSEKAAAVFAKYGFMPIK